MTYTETSFPARDRWNDRMVREVVVAGPVSYTAGGDPLSPSTNLGMAEAYAVYGVLTNGSAVRIPVLNYATQAVQFYIPNTGAEVAGAVDLSGFTGTLLFTGKG